jgi:protocatechuate 3,4-dioxygenase beta subunit
MFVNLHQHLALPGLLTFVVAFSCWAGECTFAKGQAPARGRDQTKFTEAPGPETDAVQKLIDQAKTALASGKSTTAILTNPIFLSAHEWPRFRKLIRESAQSSQTTIVTPREPGESLVVTGRVVDADGRPAKQAVMYVYQTSAKGWYSDRAAHISAREGDRKHARLFGYLKTDAEGRFELRTIRPGGYPESDLPAHIHVEIERADKEAGNFTTEIQFDGDPRLTPAWRKRSQQEGFVIGKVKKDSKNRHQVEVELKMR